jgi:signal peptidase I
MKLKEKKQTMKTKFQLISNIIGYAVFSFIFIMVLIVSVQSISGGTPNFFGYVYYYIQTNSMDGDYEDSFSAKTVVISKLINEEDCYSLKVGDIITFEPHDASLPSYVTTETHRIIDIDYEDKTIITQGDNKLTNKIPDKQISFSQVKSKFIKKSPTLTWLYTVLRSFWGFFLLIFLPLSVLIGVNIFTQINAYKKRKATDEVVEDNQKKLEEEKKTLEEQAIKEYLESLNKDKEIK